MPEATMPSKELLGVLGLAMVTLLTLRLWPEAAMPCEPKPLIAPPLIETGVLEAETPAPLAFWMLTPASTRPKLDEPTVLVAPLEIWTPLLGNLIVVPLSAPLPRTLVVKSWVKLSVPQSPAAGLPQPVVTKTEGHSTSPTALSRRVVMVAPPAVASSVAPWKVSVPKLFTTALAGRVRVEPDVIVRPFTTTCPRRWSVVSFVGVIQEALLVRVPSNAMASRPLALPWLPSTLPLAPNPAVIED